MKHNTVRRFVWRIDQKRHLADNDMYGRNKPSPLQAPKELASTWPLLVLLGSAWREISKDNSLAEGGPRYLHSPCRPPMKFS